jgi:hypothetical protein
VIESLGIEHDYVGVTVRGALQQIRNRDALNFARADIGVDIVDLVAEFADLLVGKGADAVGPAGQPSAAAVERIHGHRAPLLGHGALQENHAGEVAIGALQLAKIVRLRLDKGAGQFVPEDRQIERIGAIAVIGPPICRKFFAPSSTTASSTKTSTGRRT